VFEGFDQPCSSRPMPACDAWIRRFALVLVADRFARVDEDNRALVVAPRLHADDGMSGNTRPPSRALSSSAISQTTQSSAVPE